MGVWTLKQGRLSDAERRGMRAGSSLAIPSSREGGERVDLESVARAQAAEAERLAKLAEEQSWPVEQRPRVEVSSLRHTATARVDRKGRPIRKSLEAELRDAELAPKPEKEKRLRGASDWRKRAERKLMQLVRVRPVHPASAFDRRRSSGPVQKDGNLLRGYKRGPTNLRMPRAPLGVWPTRGFFFNPDALLKEI